MCSHGVQLCALLTSPSRCRYVRHSSLTLAPPLGDLASSVGHLWMPSGASILRWAAVSACNRVHSLGTRATHNVPAGAVCDHRRMRPSVLIIDDHEDFRRSARAMLQAEGFAVVGEAGDGAEAIAKARAVRPDVVLMDIQLPDLDGFAVAERIAAWPDPPSSCSSPSRDAAVCRSRLASTPARGFIAKSQLSGEALADLVA
jgi:CheY-like chemotaxis protein